MNKLLITALILMLSVFPFGCDDKKEEKEEPQFRDSQVAGEMMCEEECEELDMMMEEEEPCELEEGCEEVDSEMPQEEQMDMDPEPMPPECPEGQEC
jgi:hypothetical protein